MSALPADRAFDVECVAAGMLRRLEARGFFADYWERARLHVPRIFEPDEVDRLFPLQKFDEVVTSGGLMAPNMDVVCAGRKYAAPLRQSPSPGTDVEQVLEAIADGATLRVAHMEQYLHSLGSACRTLERRLRAPIRANLYLTPPFSQGYRPHFDLEDIFVVQVHGSKIWSLHNRYRNQAALPNQALTYDPELHMPVGVPDELTLNRGDVLYLPRGAMHEARTEEDASIHITFAVVGTSYGDFMLEMVRELASRDVALRRLVTSDTGGLDASAAIEGVRRAIRGLDDPALIASVHERMDAAFAAHRNPGLKGRLAESLLNGFGA